MGRGLRAKLVAVGLIVALAGVGCQSNAPDPSADRGGASTSTPAAVSKAELIEQVDAICAENGAATQAARPVDPTDVGEVTQHYRQYLELGRVAVDKAEALGPPDTDVEAWEQLIADMHAFLDVLEADLEQVVVWTVTNDGAALRSSEVGLAQQRWVDESKAFGLKVCGTPGTSSA